MQWGTAPWVGALAVQWVQRRRRSGQIAAVTATNARCILGAFVDAVGDRPADQLDRRHIARWQETLGVLAPATQRTRVSVVRGFSTWLLTERHVSRDLMAGVPVPREPRRLPRGIPGAQSGVARLLAHCPDARARCIVVLLIQCGLRVGEVARLQLGDIDAMERSIRVSGKGGHERVVWLPDEAIATIGDYLAEHPCPAGPLIRSYRDPRRALTADTISGMVAEWMATAGIKRRPRDGVTAHALRHQAAHDMLRRGASIRDVQFVLGHRHSQTTEIYLPLLTTPLEAVMAGRTYRLEA